MSALQSKDPGEPKSLLPMQAYARICRFPKAGLIIYVPHVMYGSVKVRRQNPDIQVFELNEDVDSQDGFEYGYE